MAKSGNLDHVKPHNYEQTEGEQSSQPEQGSGHQRPYVMWFPRLFPPLRRQHKWGVSDDWLLGIQCLITRAKSDVYSIQDTWCWIPECGTNASWSFFLTWGYNQEFSGTESTGWIQVATWRNKMSINIWLDIFTKKVFEGHYVSRLVRNDGNLFSLDLCKICNDFALNIFFNYLLS